MNILNINPLLDASLENMFHHLVGCHFVLLMVSFAVQKLFSLIWSHLFFFFSFVSLAQGDISEIMLLIEISEILLAVLFFF